MATKDTTKELLNKLEVSLGFVQIFSFFYAFFCVLYWFLDLAKINFLSKLSFLFEPTFDWVRTFYVQKTIPIEKTDLAPVVAAIIVVIIAIIANGFKDKVIYQKEMHRVAMIKKKQQDDLLIQQQIEREYLNEMKKYDKFIILVDFNIQQIKSYLFDNNVDQDELRGLKISLMSKLFADISGDYIIQKSKYENDSFYIIGELKSAAECLETITSGIKKLSLEYGHMNITLSHDFSFDAILDTQNINEELEFLKKVIQLNYSDCIITTSLFKTCFELITKSKLRFSVLGNFQFIINGKSSNYELYRVQK